MIDLPAKFIERMRAQLGPSADRFFASYDRAVYRGIRVNSLKTDREEFKKISPFGLSAIDWEENGFYVSSEKAGKTVLHAAGLYYVQEPSAMSVAPLLQVKEGERVLDLCSAPGGKGTQLAQSLRGIGVIVLNEINFARAKILSQNVERLGITNAAVISENPERIGEYFEGYFEKVLVDAPCSGEGMFLKEKSAFSEWSEENVLACARRQSFILDSAQRALKTGGLLAYSTCTFAEEEDERQIENFLKTYGNFTLLYMKKYLPHECKGEGHFVAILKKTDGNERSVPLFQPKIDKKSKEEWRGFCADTGYGASAENLHAVGDIIYNIMPECPSLPFNTLRCGLRLGEIKKGRIEPCHALAMSLPKGCGADVDEKTAISYLSGNSIGLDGGTVKNGWVPVCYSGYPLGWGKAVDGIIKNHLPKGLRIR